VPSSRIVAATALVVASATAGTVAVVRSQSDDDTVSVHGREISQQETKQEPTTTRAPASTTSTAAPTTTIPHNPARSFDPKLVRTINGAISPKSVIATGTGYVFAQNMMYRHTVTVYNADGSLAKTIPDSVNLAQFGVGGHPGVSRGAPVEAAVDHNRNNVFVTNYAMYGANHGPEGSDDCRGPGGLTPSYVYRINLAKLTIDGVGQVGIVPKYIAVSPGDKYVLVTNWCSYDMSVLHHGSLKEVRRIRLGAYPRGIAVDRAGRYAFVAVMGSTRIARVDLNSFGTTWFEGVGSSPRHVVLSADDKRLFVTLNGSNQVVAVNTATGAVVDRVSTGSQPRSMDISADGQALYVVNYSSNTVSVLRASDLGIVKTFNVPSHPIGIAYEPTQHRVWVACYSGEIRVYDA
jgi:YVTN family beta-propeller protein